MTPTLRSRHKNRRLLRPAARQRGVATLVVVMVLFFILSMVAAYTSRNLIFEQRTSANQYRSTQALEAAEAGVEWTLALLNGGRIDADCQPTADATRSTFRERYFEPIAADGTLALRVHTASGGALMPVCVFDAATNGWSCKCPAQDDDDAVLLPEVAGAAAKPMFRIRFEFIPIAESTRRDVVRIVAAGCTRPDASCIAEAPTAPAGDALSVVTSLIAMKSGLSTPPGAPLTVRVDLNGGTGPLSLTNTDPATEGVTLLMGGAAIAGTQPTLNSLPGTPGETSVVIAECSLMATATADCLTPGLEPITPLPAPALVSSQDRLFARLFGMTPAMYAEQPAALVVDCTTAACAAADINPLVQANPGRMLWLNGTLTVDGDIGTAAAPALLVVSGNTGNVTLSSGTVFGLIYSRAADWNRGPGTTLINGALVAETSLSGNGTQSVVYDPAVLTLLRTQHGSFVRVPGGWRDFQ